MKEANLAWRLANTFLANILRHWFFIKKQKNGKQYAKQSNITRWYKNANCDVNRMIHCILDFDFHVTAISVTSFIFS